MNDDATPREVGSTEGLGLAPERATVSLTLADLQILAATASRNDTHHAFQAVALEWCGKAQAEIDRLRAADAALADVAMMLKMKGEVDRLREERDALAQTLNKAEAIGEMLAAVVQGAKEDFVRVPYGASHEDVAAINDWHKMAAEALAAWENKA